MAIFLAVSVGASAAGQTYVQNVRWEHQPDWSAYARFYPPNAMNHGLNGDATLDCVVNEDRHLTCSVIEEAPIGAGFGEAAQHIAGLYVATSQTADGAPSVGLHTRIPFQFRTGNGGVTRMAESGDMFWTSGAITQFYPRRAKEHHIEGNVVLDCTVNARLRYECTLVSETPPDWGFGRAALRMMDNFYLTAAAGEASPVGRRQRFPIHFHEPAPH